VYCVAPVDIVAAYNGIADSYLMTGIACCGDRNPVEYDGFHRVEFTAILSACGGRLKFK
jgi:hypothetical protein